jgi:hypothetical protein
MKTSNGIEYSEKEIARKYPSQTTCTLCWRQMVRESGNQFYPWHDSETITRGIDTCGGKKNVYFSKGNIVKKSAEAFA